MTHDAETSASRTAILILGTHRTGTSALTRAFNLLGADVPKTLLGATDANQTGHWESVPVCRLNDRILAALGSDWRDIRPVEPATLPQVRAFADEARMLLREEFGDSPFFVLKDPRICRLVPFWLDVLRSMDVRPVVVTPLRAPVEVASSLAKRNGFDGDFGHMIWLHNVLEAEARSRGVRRVFTRYDALLTSWRPVAETVAAGLGIAWPVSIAAAGDEIDGFLSGDYRHHDAGQRDTAPGDSVSAAAEAVYGLLGQWTGRPEGAAERAWLDAERERFDASIKPFAAAIVSGQIAIDEKRKLERQVARLEERLAGARENAEKHKQRADAFKAKAEELRESRTKRDEKIQRLTEKLAKAEAGRD